MFDFQQEERFWKKYLPILRTSPFLGFTDNEILFILHCVNAV